jgi:hypothetical protein
MTIYFYQMTINERLELLISTLKQNNNSFSNSIGVNSTIIHNIVKGRNAPSYDILNKIALSYDDINMNWLISEKGEILTEKSDFNAHGSPDSALKRRSSSSSCIKCQDNEKLILKLKDKLIDCMEERSELQSKLFEMLQENKQK